MKKQYDFSRSAPNPYVQRRRKKQVTIRLDETTLEYFKAMAESSGVPYQSLMNLYLRECAAERKKLKMVWEP